jgi:hypothetical protein
MLPGDEAVVKPRGLAAVPHDAAPGEPARCARQRLAFRDVRGLAGVAPEDVQLLVVSGLGRGVSGLVLVG